MGSSRAMEQSFKSSFLSRNFGTLGEPLESINWGDEDDEDDDGYYGEDECERYGEAYAMSVLREPPLLLGPAKVLVSNPRLQMLEEIISVSEPMSDVLPPSHSHHPHSHPPQSSHLSYRLGSR